MTEIARLRRSVEQARACAAEVRTAFGSSPAVSRVLNDIDRLEIDIEELEAARRKPQAARQDQPIAVPDTPYDESLWVGADDEGIGGFHGERS